MTVHPNTEIHSSAILGNNVTVAPFSTIGPDVRIGDNTEIGPNVLITGGAVIGKDCRIFHGASMGGDPQILGFKDIPSSVEVGDRTVVREYVTIHRSGNENEKTRVGADCMLMAYSHVAHDCQIGNNVVVVNYAGISGHVIVEDSAFIAGHVGIHQFVRIGKYAMVGGMAGVSKDVLPFSLVTGNPARLMETNTVGLKRSNFKPKIRSAIKNAFKFIHQSDLNTSQAVDKIEKEIEMFDEIRYLIDFIKDSSRGITK